jgi:hypothetical protein
MTSPAAGRTISLETSGLLEVLGVSGTFSVVGGGKLGAGTYHCEVGECPGLTLACEQAGSLMISHDAELRVSQQQIATDP